MKLAVAALAALLTIVQSTPVLAWDPFAGESDDPADGSQPTDSAAFVIPDGLYVVTDVYTGDVVTSSGATTTYATTTAHDTPGTWARVIETVASGESGANDGTSMNGRARMADGRLVAGTYYEDFVLTEAGFLAVNVVFFQDDNLTIAAATPAPSTAATPPSAATTAPLATPPPASTAAPIWSAPAPAPAATIAPPSAPAHGASGQTATAGVALAESGPVLASIEVLRGRRVALWPRAFVNGAAVPVRSWRLVSGWADAITPLSGTAGVPCDASWLTLAPAGSTWTLRFELTSDAIPGRTLVATIDVLVRSPALEQ